MELVEKLHEITGGRFGGFQLYDSGTTAGETVLSHTLATAALKSHYNKTVEVLD